MTIRARDRKSAEDIVALIEERARRAYARRRSSTRLITFAGPGVRRGGHQCR